jgi:methanesulfonate monooxygenase small subunit
MDKDKAVSELIYRSCMLMDDCDFDGFLELCAPDFRYKIAVFSHEILKEMVWQDADKAELERHLRLVPKHVSDPAPLSRHPTVYTISYEDGGQAANVTTGFQVYKTTLDAGTTALFAIGRYYDRVRLDAKGPQLSSRTVRLETRQLGPGSQIPF